MTKQLIPHSDSSHKHIVTRHTENEDFQVKWVIQTSSPKGVTFKSRKKAKELWTSHFTCKVFTFLRQSNFKGKKKTTNHPYTYTRIVLDICLLCTWTRRLWICCGWKVYWKQSMHIYIYTYIKGRELGRCCKHMLCAFSHGSDFSSVCAIRSLCSHLYSPIPASLQLA